MPLRSDPSLWFNLPGVVAAYQPVAAPDSLLARYNMAHGGDNRYRAEPGVLPAWSGAKGWTSTSADFITASGLIPASNQRQASIARISSFVSVAGVYPLLMGSYEASNRQFGVSPGGNAVNQTIFRNGGQQVMIPELSAGTLAVSGSDGYRNGKKDVSAIPGYVGTFTTPISVTAGLNGVFVCGAYYNRTLSPAEVWSVSRQMQYCDVNPDWSVWSPRRKWFPYVLAAGGFQAAWAERANRLIGGG